MLQEHEIEALFLLARQATGMGYEEPAIRRAVVADVERRMAETRCKDLSSYLSLAAPGGAERDRLLSMLSNSTTWWFRERELFEDLPKLLASQGVLKGLASEEPLRVLSAGCATGREAYSVALVLESHRQAHPGFDYRIEGVDVNPSCQPVATRAVFPAADMDEIPAEYHRHLLVGSGRTQGYFTLTREIRDRCSFRVGDAFAPREDGQLAPNVIYCRNMLIYYPQGRLVDLIARLARQLAPGGLLVLGGSDPVSAASECHEVARIEGAVTAFRKKPDGQVRILVVDDSPTMRTVLKAGFEKASFQVALAEGPEAADRILASERIDVISLDLEMPGEDGVKWLKRRRSEGMRVPVAILTGAERTNASRVLGALTSGAQDYFLKSEYLSGSEALSARLKRIALHYRRLGPIDPVAGIRTLPLPGFRAPEPRRLDALLFGASTGGPDALVRVLRSMPAGCPPVFVVQHIQESFAEAFAEMLAEAAGLKLGRVSPGEPALPGHLYMSTVDQHLVLQKDPAGRPLVSLEGRAPSDRHCPSVDRLFDSAVPHGDRVAACLLTGMGADGAQGLKALRDAGALTTCQNESSCVVFGMPKVAIEKGAASFVGDPASIRAFLELAMGVTSRDGAGEPPARRTA